MRTPRVLPLLTLLLMPACHRADAPASADAAPSSATSSNAPVASAASNAPAADPASAPSCALVTKAEAEAILGEKLDDLRVAVNGMCEYVRASDHGKTIFMPLVGLKLYPNESKKRFEDETQSAANLLHQTRKPISGFGEEAYEMLKGEELMILEHGKAISVTHIGQALDRGKFEAFARKALSRL